MPPMLQLDVQQIVSQSLSFLLLLWVLRRFAWRPVLGILDARRAHIDAELRALDERQQELTRAQAEYGRRLTAIEAEARAKLQEAILEGKRIAGEIQEEARAQAHQILTKSKETVELEVAKARVTLRDQMAELTMGAVERILRATLDDARDVQLVHQTLDELDRKPARA